MVAATKLSAGTGDTLCDSTRVVRLPRAVFPAPCYGMAVRPAARGDEAKVAAAVQKLLEEDQTLSYVQNPATNEMILSGLGEQHLTAVVSKLKEDFGVEGKYKKQSGGHGQYGDVWIEFEPYPSDDLVFEEKVFGGAVPRNFFPAVEKGLQESFTKGVLAGFPMVGVKAILVDGSYHPVDSSEMSFKTAASLAYKEGMKQAEPTLLEPMGSLEVSIPDDCTGDIMGDLNKRRGRVLGMNPGDEGMTVIQAEVPLREMADYALQLRQMTQGEGVFRITPALYQQLPSNLVAEVIASASE